MWRNIQKQPMELCFNAVVRGTTMTDFLNEVKKIEKQIKAQGYDEKAEQELRKRWKKLNKR